MKNYIYSLRNKCSPSSSPKIIFLHLSAEIISPILTYFLNKFITNGFFSNSLKVAEIIPIYKKGSKTNMDNYRPIALLSPLAKLYETHINKQLTNFFNKSNVFYHNQFGFREKSSTDLAVINSVNEIINSMDQNYVNCSVFLDLSKAFNIVNHKVLLKKMEKYGVRGTPLNLIKNYLLNREQVTTVNNHTSKNLKINVGVPQGSCLGPLFFIIYINDMHLASNFKIKLFGDDACLSLNHKDSHTLENNVNNELIKINSWLQSNKLFLNYSKTNYLIFTKKKIKPKLNISINNHILKQKESVKYLGIIIDQNISWKPHIDKLKSTLSRNCYALSKLKKIRSGKHDEKCLF